uniref:hypothetical protein n=1 Tax=Sphingomonas sp. TaxID=28214 RepID=UPI0025DA8B72|nr:hypothetical protein [Sphingomonas sp.]
MATRKKPADCIEPNNALIVDQTKDETGAQAMARKLLEPHLRHALTASAFAGKVLGGDIKAPGIMDFVDHVQKAAGKAEAGDLAIASRLLASQAITLDAMFTELARRAALNMGEYINAAESYGRLALKAQSNCRATLGTLAKLHQPREQTVRHVHVNEGGQAVIADQFHHHTGGHQNAESTEQPYAAGAVAAGSGSAMFGQDAQGNGLPIPGGEREPALSDARRQGKRCT